MKHYIKTASGISGGFITFGKKKLKRLKRMVHNDGTTYTLILALLGPIGGVGQGGGASPIIWLAVLLIMLIVYRKFHKGVSIEDRVSAMIIVMWILSYVDDNTIIQGFEHDTTIKEMLETMKACILTWNRLLKLTGGALSLEKCKVLILKWKMNYWGILTPMSL